MFRRHKRKPSLLGEAFAMKESKAWEDVADNIHIQEKIARDRQRLMMRLGLATLGIAIVLVVVLKLL